MDEKLVPCLFMREMQGLCVKEHQASVMPSEEQHPSWISWDGISPKTLMCLLNLLSEGTSPDPAETGFG